MREDDELINTYMSRSSSEKFSTSVLTSNATFAANNNTSGCTLYPSTDVSVSMSPVNLASTMDGTYQSRLEGP